MKDAILYKNFIGSVHYAAEDEVFYGKIEGIDDLVSFEGDSVQSLKKSFTEAVDDYLYLCESSGKEPQKSYRGSFNVRIPQKLHQQAVRLSQLEGLSLNQFVQSAIEHEVERRKNQ